jgi:hypothetical protein
VNIARSATLSPFLLALLYAAFSPSMPGVNTLQAAPPISKVSRGATALTFNVTARVGATGQGSGVQQTVHARVLLRGNAARIESSSGGTPSVVLFSPPYVYRLLPASKAGVRWKLDAARDSNLADFDPQSLLRDPSKIRAALIGGGAKKTGNAVVNGVAAEIYQARDFGRKGQRATVWLRKSDSLPLRLEASGGQLQIIASWRDYARPKNLPTALFSVPKGFRVRSIAGRPPFSVL